MSTVDLESIKSHQKFDRKSTDNWRQIDLSKMGSRSGVDIWAKSTAHLRQIWVEMRSTFETSFRLHFVVDLWSTKKIFMSIGFWLLFDVYEKSIVGRLKKFYLPTWLRLSFDAYKESTVGRQKKLLCDLISTMIWRQWRVNFRLTEKFSRSTQFRPWLDAYEESIGSWPNRRGCWP